MPRSRPSGYLERYNLTRAKPMEVILHLFYRMCVAQSQSDEQVLGVRSWTGGAKARVPGQELVYSDGAPLPDPPLELEHVLQVLDWLFTEVKITYWPETPHDDNAGPACYLTRLQCVNAQPLAAGLLHTKHRPYDMLAAVFLCANSMPATEAQAHRLRAHEHRFMQMYLQQAQEFDYLPKDKYHHNSVWSNRVAPGPARGAPEPQAPELGYMPRDKFQHDSVWSNRVAPGPARGAPEPQAFRVVACVPVAYSACGAGVLWL